ncbi:MAG: plasmid pRiA4b ORF-3 family protein [Treponema sp.]|jgi:hypothetical protein|nr:plasmid pRiA4b ORF-3 family protein [Treponema sp.]
MTSPQEDALYDFLQLVSQPFNLEEAVRYVRVLDCTRLRRLIQEIPDFIDSRRMAFRIGNRRWVSRRCFFEGNSFVIKPTKLEIINNILIPGHRCVPFVNPDLSPKDYHFYCDDLALPETTSEASPEDFYPFYNIFGEEYTPQYLARECPENEAAYNEDPYEDPEEVSINTIDMSRFYKEQAFAFGDLLIVKTLDWKEGKFSIEKKEKGAWEKAALDEWQRAAEAGFMESFKRLGPGASTEEQIAYAYWYGDKRMRELPAYPLEEFFFEKTNYIETVVFGIESRFWYSGRDIPDRKDIDCSQPRTDKTYIERILCDYKIPISEYALQAYVWDAVFRGETGTAGLIKRLLPQGVTMRAHDMLFIEDYVRRALIEFSADYNPFAEKVTGPLRQRAIETHSAVLNLATMLRKSGIDEYWLPHHTFITLTQIQMHAAGILEDLDLNTTLEDSEVDAMENSVDMMVETYDELKELINDALQNFREDKFRLIQDADEREAPDGRLVQVSIGGLDVWRRLLVNEDLSLASFFIVIQAAFGWSGPQDVCFRKERHLEEKEPPPFDNARTLREIRASGIKEFHCEYGDFWMLRVIFLSAGKLRAGQKAVCVAGAEAAPPESLVSPLHYKKLLDYLFSGPGALRSEAVEILGKDFKSDHFDADACNQRIASITFE